MANERLDIVIFGATGFTGKFVVREAERLCKEKNFTWGIAGRRKDALLAVLKEYAPESENIVVIYADVTDEESLVKMTKQAKVIVNCCGPYRLYGEPVVKACLGTRTHHVDVSGEPQYMEAIQYKYNKSAQDIGVYVVSACGIDSIPTDLGIIYTQNKFRGDVNSVETYMRMKVTGDVGGSSLMNYATWESAVNGAANVEELRELRKKLYPERLPERTPKLKPNGRVHRSYDSNGWSTAFPGADHAVCSRTQRFLYEKYKQRPVQIQTYFTFDSLNHVISALTCGGMVSILVKSEYGRNLLLKHPKFFTNGMISHEAPTPETMENTQFSVTFVARGWTEKLSNPLDRRADPPNKELITRVSCKNPAYGATCTAVLLSALTILRESDKMPDEGGVLSPGAAFGRTSLIDELDSHGMKFEFVVASTDFGSSSQTPYMNLSSKL